MASTLVRTAATVACTVVMTGMGAGVAQAGEIKGNGERNVPEHMHPGKSFCAYSGQNDEFHEDPDGEHARVQSFGQDVKASGPMGGVPGTWCNPTRAPF